MLFDAHARSLAALGGVARRGIYDNLKPAVDKVNKGKGRTVNARFAVMLPLPVATVGCMLSSHACGAVIPHLMIAACSSKNLLGECTMHASPVTPSANSALYTA